MVVGAQGSCRIGQYGSVSQFIGIAIHNGSNDPMVVTAYDDNIEDYCLVGIQEVVSIVLKTESSADILAMHNERVTVVPCEVITCRAQFRNR